MQKQAFSRKLSSLGHITSGSAQDRSNLALTHRKLTGPRLSCNRFHARLFPVNVPELSWFHMRVRSSVSQCFPERRDWLQTTLHSLRSHRRDQYAGAQEILEDCWSICCDSGPQ